jgi:hypothetical protein
MAEMILAPSLPGHCWYSMSKKLKNNDNISDLTQYEKFALIIPKHRLMDFIRNNITRLPIFPENFYFMMKSLLRKATNCESNKIKIFRKKMGSRVIFG